MPIQGASDSIFVLWIMLKIDPAMGFFQSKKPDAWAPGFEETNVTVWSHRKLDYFARAFTRTVRREIFRDAVFL